MNSENNNNEQVINNNVQPTQQVNSQVNSNSEMPINNVTQNVSEVEQAIKQNETIMNEVTMTPKEKRVVEDLKMPELSTNQVVIETIKKKPKSSSPYIIVLLLVAFLVVWKMDYILDFFDKTNTNPGISNQEENNLVNGYLLIGDTTSNLKVNNIKFYNFKKNLNGSSYTFEYVAIEKINKDDFKNIYIELYDADKNVIYKSLFDLDDNLGKGEVKTNTFNVDNYIYENAKYAFVKEYKENEINKESTLVCELKETSENYSLTYKNTYTFKNDLLVSYSISKNIEIYAEDSNTSKYQNDIKSEYDIISENEIQSTYENNTLTYTIDLTKDIGSFIPLYEKGTTLNTVKNKDIEKKWNCE